MCGIFGIIPKSQYINQEKQQALKEVFYFLCAANQARGEHSWGVWHNHGTMKNVGSIMAGMKHIRENLNKVNLNNTFLAGHTRHATHGGRTIENAHPFRFEDESGKFVMRLAHNGVVTVDGYTDKDHPVDSGRIGLSIFNSFLEKLEGVSVPTVILPFKKGISAVSGSCSLAFSINKELMLYRHNQQLGLTELSDVFVFSSAEDHITKALMFTGLEGKNLEITQDHLCRIMNDRAMLFHAPAKAYTYAGHKDWDSDRTYGARTYVQPTLQEHYDLRTDKEHKWCKGPNGEWRWERIDDVPTTPKSTTLPKESDEKMLLQKPSGSITPFTPKVETKEEEPTTVHPDPDIPSAEASEASDLTCDACGQSIKDDQIAYNMEDVDDMLIWFFTYETVCQACCTDLEQFAEQTLRKADSLAARLLREGKTIVGSGRETTKPKNKKKPIHKA